MKSKWLPTLFSVGMGVFALLTPDIQTAIVAHPHLATGLGFAYAILKGILPSPIHQDPK